MSGRFKIEGMDMMHLMITMIAAGRQFPGGVDRLVEFLPGFFDICRQHLGDNPAAVADRIYVQTQNMLMAYRRDDFVTIQKEPPFLRQGKANFISILSAYYEGGREHLRVALEEVIKHGEQSVSDEQPIQYSGGSGSSMHDAVTILTSDPKLGVAAEYWYLNYTYGRVNKRGQSLKDGGNGRHYDCVSVDTPNGEVRTVYFDVSNFYGR